jgi:hypothetical protein
MKKILFYLVSFGWNFTRWSGSTSYNLFDYLLPKDYFSNEVIVLLKSKILEDFDGKSKVRLSDDNLLYYYQIFCLFPYALANYKHLMKAYSVQTLQFRGIPPKTLQVDKDFTEFSITSGIAASVSGRRREIQNGKFIFRDDNLVIKALSRYATTSA